MKEEEEEEEDDDDDDDDDDEDDDDDKDHDDDHDGDCLKCDGSSDPMNNGLQTPQVKATPRPTHH